MSAATTTDSDDAGVFVLYTAGQALLMLKREPMDKRYAHMFKGKNRMFEVQVQGKFKKPPDGELYISLEITERMKLGLLTRVSIYCVPRMSKVF